MTCALPIAFTTSLCSVSPYQMHSIRPIFVSRRVLQAIQCIGSTESGQSSQPSIRISVSRECLGISCVSRRGGRRYEATKRNRRFHRHVFRQSPANHARVNDALRVFVRSTNFEGTPGRQACVERGTSHLFSGGQAGRSSSCSSS